MTKAEAQNNYRLLTAHLQQANEIAARLAVYLGHVDGPAPKRGNAKKKRLDAMYADLSAKRIKRLKLKVV